MTTRAVFCDALGTLVELKPPWTRLAAELGTKPDQRLVAAVRAEMSYYRDHAHEGRDEAALADLRARCAAVLSRELGREVGVEPLLASIRFRAYEDAAPALARLRRRGLTLVCVSNWDYALPEVLAGCGLDGLLDGVVTSAGASARKPDPAIFRAALAIAACAPGEAIHVGDTLAEDIAGARAAGIEPLHLERGSRAGAGRIASLTEIEEHLRP